MRRSRGFSMMEILVGIAVMAIVLLSGFNFFSSALRSFWKTDTRLDLSQQSALAMRRITQELRSAVTVTIANNGQTLFYQLPLQNNFADPVTGEFELAEPLQSDGVVRSFFVENGTLYHASGGDTRAIVRNLSLIDPSQDSTYHNQNYPIFSVAAPGLVRGVQVLLISRKQSSAGDEYTRMSTVINLRNLL